MKRSSLHNTSFQQYIIVFVILCFLLPCSAFAKQTAVIKNIKLANTRDDLLTYFDVKQAFTERLNQAALNGIPTTFSFYIALYKTGGLWFDKKIAKIQINSTLKYNPLKKEFTVLRPWKNETPVITQSFQKAKSLMTEIDNLKIIPLNQLVKGDKYQLRIKAKLDKVTLPLSLHTVLFFVSFWDFETNWYLINFTY
ncbi:DUF4390 domain-containing protein [Desulfobacula toluolica]|uniref:Conserved uncharacterized protein n=1 Tax=Desulfobacula toluolica (strain DSM 7467 / Tol2) TaxID=651182 RepID=K0NDB4_DESTT|nr:DUF4390 domain-containing protein [Desulfobacula toluolica]CCK78775.1 conserved uncharacterized protein [Desulfobacula toluolica Tol2]